MILSNEFSSEARLRTHAMYRHIPDGLLATFKAPAAGIRCAAAMREAVRTPGLEIRVGLHAGEYKVSGGEVIGLAFHIGARVAAPKAGVRFEDRGVHQLKGVPKKWPLFRVER